MFSVASCFRCGPPPSAFKVPITTKRWIVTKCPGGHALALVFQASGWALLFERALQRVAADLPRDAVLDAYTAFEMYLAEVPIRARYDRESGASPRQLRSELRSATKRAELAIGAARAAASIVSGRPAPTWNDQTTTNVRNDAIHAGVYPSIEAAERLCVEVGDVILEFERLLDAQTCANPCPYHRAVWAEEISALRESHPQLNPTFVSGGHMFDWTHTATSRPSVVSRIAEYRTSPPAEGSG